jgi:hypothetical protein
MPGCHTVSGQGAAAVTFRLPEHQRQISFSSKAEYNIRADEVWNLLLLFDSHQTQEVLPCPFYFDNIRALIFRRCHETDRSGAGTDFSTFHS